MQFLCCQILRMCLDVPKASSLCTGVVVSVYVCDEICTSHVDIHDNKQYLMLSSSSFYNNNCLHQVRVVNEGAKMKT